MRRKNNSPFYKQIAAAGFSRGGDLFFLLLLDNNLF